ncbi:MAG TPA: putative LPS assembly protein LptD, partial [Flavobacterium sp.]|nr:putative LPS assembly protein LptD [Flavobacterium sp.]
MQTKVLYIVFNVFMMIFFHQNTNAQEPPLQVQGLLTDSKQDTIKNQVSNDSILPPVNKQSSSQKLTDLAYRDAKGYERLDEKNKRITLYDQAVFKYLDYELQSGIIVYDYEKEEIYAGRIKDSLGNLTQPPIFKQGSQTVEPDSIRFNMNSKKAIIWNTRTQYTEFNIKAEKSKRINDSLIYMRNIRFTTSEDVDNPEYYFQTNKLKLVPGKKIVTGVTNMVIADVPTPIALPFAFFPMTKDAVSGFIIPSFGDNNQRGYYIQNGGYYFAFSDRLDLTVLGDYYTNGSHALSARSTYAQRYKYRGDVNIRYEQMINSEFGFPDYSKQKIYNIQWSHTQDQKANPSSRFNASVNLGSSTYFRNSMNQQNIGANMNNTMSSSITYSKNFDFEPRVNFTISANHMQNTNTQQITMSLPRIQAGVDQIYPFAPKNGSKKGFIQNLNLQYNLNGDNRINTTDSLFFKSEMFKNMNTGFQHQIPLSTNFKLMKYFSVSMSANYSEVWVLNTIRRFYDANQNRVIDERVNGFDAFRSYNFNANIGTTLYGTFNFKKGSKIEAIRHVIRPSVSYAYTPSFEQYYDTYAIDANGTTMEEYT